MAGRSTLDRLMDTSAASSSPRSRDSTSIMNQVLGLGDACRNAPAQHAAGSSASPR
jgi:hypothetical protein